jgi:uncharacterized coiled-coil DUF342 family protein
MSKAVDQTDKEAEYYRAMVVSQGDTIELLKHNIREMQEQIYTLYKRIDELNNGNMERKTSDRD